MQFKRSLITLAALALATGIAGCAPDPEPTVGETPAVAATTAAPEVDQTTEPAVETTDAQPTDQGMGGPEGEPESEVLALAFAAATENGYGCTLSNPGEDFIVERFDCTKDSDTPTVVEYDDPANRGPHISTWAPRPNQPVGDRWLVATDNPRDFEFIIQEMMR